MTRNGWRSRRGAALLAVLWVLVGAGALSLAGVLASRQGIGSTGNRIALARAEWRAEDCASRALAAADVSLGGGGDSAWLRLGRSIRSHPLVQQASGCAVELSAAGSRLDLATVDSRALGALLGAIGIVAPRRDSLVDAFLDWRDADDLPRAHGAERDWYAAQGRPAPRDAVPADVRELGDIRGFELLGGLDSVLSTESGRVALNHAPLAVLASLPGFGDEAVHLAASLRNRGEEIGSLVVFAEQLSPPARAELLSRFPEVSPMTTASPDAWLLLARGRTDGSGVSAVLELRLVRTGNRTAVVRRRTWVE